VKRRLATALALSAALGAAPALAVGTEAYLGQVALVANLYCPPNALPADGRLLQINQNAALYQLIENTYGGKYEDHTFALPDLSGKAPAGMLYCIVVVGIWPSQAN
jgi:microcystin-dependent protein